MKGVPPGMVRRLLIVACVIAALPVAWRVGGAAAELQRAVAAYHLGIDLQLEGRFDEAADAFRNTIALYPRMVEAHRRLASVEVSRGRINEAIGAYRGITAVYPYSHSADLHREIGFIELNDGRLEDARTDLLRAVALDPGDWRSHQLLANVYQRQGDVERAGAALQRVLDLKRSSQRGL